MADDAGSVKVVVQIRRATPYDFVNILRLGDQIYENTDEVVGYPKLDQMKTMRLILDCKTHGEILVADCSRQIVGSLGLVTREWPWSNERFISNEWFHVLPKFRSAGTCDALLKAAEHFADEHKTRLVIAFSGGKKASVKDRMMQMKGYIYAGGSFHRMPQEKTA